MMNDIVFNLFIYMTDKAKSKHENVYYQTIASKSIYTVVKKSSFETNYTSLNFSLISVNVSSGRVDSISYQSSYSLVIGKNVTFVCTVRWV